MTKYEIYADGDNRPVKKLKREYDALNFISDVRNLARYGCMTLVRESDDGETMVWDEMNSVWKKEFDPESQMEGYV